MYRNSKIYKLVNSVDNRIYVGSTVNSLSRRKSGHRTASIKQPTRPVYAHLNSVGWEHVSIILIENYVCSTKDELRAREQYYIDLLNPSLNKIAAIDNCPHGKQRNRCISCGGVGICEHGRQRHGCIQCGGSSICEHKRERNKCIPCGGASICEHELQRNQCKTCSGVECDFCGTSHPKSDINRHNRTEKHKKNYEAEFLSVFGSELHQIQL